MSDLQAIISPSILSADFSQLGSSVLPLLSQGADWLHLDVMDGQFVPAFTFGSQVVKDLGRFLQENGKGQRVWLDCHMMVLEPEKWVDPIANAGGNGFTFHYEATDNHMSVITAIIASGMKPAMAISPATPSSVLTDELVGRLSMLLVMTVVPGKGGQAFTPSCLEKVRELRERFPQINIQVDGGVGPDTIDQCSCAGANVAVAGTAIFKAADSEAVIRILKSSIRKNMSLSG